jgi:hypothetical protein
MANTNITSPELSKLVWEHIIQGTLPPADTITHTYYETGSPLQVLYIASQYGNLEIVRYVVEVEKVKSLLTAGDSSPLKLAAVDGHLEIVKYLINTKTYASIKDIYLALKYSIRNGHLPIVEFLVNNLPETRNTLEPYLWESIAYGQYDIIKYFIDIGVDRKYAVQTALREFESFRFPVTDEIFRYLCRLGNLPGNITLDWHHYYYFKIQYLQDFFIVI